MGEHVEANGMLSGVYTMYERANTIRDKASETAILVPNSASWCRDRTSEVVGMCHFREHLPSFGQGIDINLTNKWGQSAPLVYRQTSNIEIVGGQH